jgi:hypothetical protein
LPPCCSGKPLAWLNISRRFATIAVIHLLLLPCQVELPCALSSKKKKKASPQHMAGELRRAPCHGTAARLRQALGSGTRRCAGNWAWGTDTCSCPCFCIMNGEGLFSATSQRSFAYHGARSKVRCFPQPNRIWVLGLNPHLTQFEFVFARSDEFSQYPS